MVDATRFDTASIEAVQRPVAKPLAARRTAPRKADAELNERRDTRCQSSGCLNPMHGADLESSRHNLRNERLALTQETIVPQPDAVTHQLENWRMYVTILIFRRLAERGPSSSTA